MKSHVLQLQKLSACREALTFAEKFDSLQVAWGGCARGDWMLWLVGKLAGPVDSDSRKKLVGMCAEIAELVLPIFEERRPDDKRVRECIETCKRYASGQATIQEVRKAQYAAEAASYAAAATATADATASAAASASAATAYASAATATAASASADAYAVSASADAYAASTKMQLQCANLVRKHYPSAPILP